MGNDGKDTITSIRLPDGCVGIWECGMLHAEAYLYTSEANTFEENQKVVDRDNCALWWPYGKGHAVIDHAESEAGEGMWRVQDMSIDSTASLTLPNGTKKYYTCIGLLRCKHRNRDYAWNNAAFAPLNKDDVVCISCATSNGSEVYVAYYQYNFSIELHSTITSIKK